jgi:hypothetical protein
VPARLLGPEELNFSWEHSSGILPEFFRRHDLHSSGNPGVVTTKESLGVAFIREVKPSARFPRPRWRVYHETRDGEVKVGTYDTVGHQLTVDEIASGDG